MKHFVLTSIVSLAALAAHPLQAAKMPREDVVDVPAVGESLCLHNLFQSNMVLQRDKPIVVRGWAIPGEEVKVELAGATVSGSAAADRSWRVTLPPMAASSTPISLTVTGRERTLKLENILVGDVWVLGGQSNMEFPLTNVENGNLEIVSANYPGIRFLTVPAQDGPDRKPAFPRLHEWSDWSSRHFRKGDWDVCTPESVRELSAIGFVFARRIHTASQVPIGVIDASRGGTTVETWTPDTVLRGIDTPQVKALVAEWDAKVKDFDPNADLEQQIAKRRSRVERLRKEGKPVPADLQQPVAPRPGPAMDQNRPGNCYASMVAPLEGFAVKGAIFHQGYNNCFNGTAGAIMYGQVFPRMIAAWRAAFGDPQMPFGILSLCTEGPVQTLENFSEAMHNAGPYIREAQYRTFLDLFQKGDRNIGFTSTCDLRRRWYHPQLKIPAGERIARWALATQYGFARQIQWKPPFLEDMKVDGSRIILRFDTEVGPVDDGSPISGFGIAGSDRRFHPATVDFLETGKDDRGRPQRDTKVLVLSSPLVPAPVHFRYAWARSPMGNLQVARNSDIPFAPHRSDDWPMEEIPLEVMSAAASNVPERQRRALVEKVLRRVDLERRLHEARALIEANSGQ